MPNRQLKKPGPKTAGGKLRSSQNATEHGLPSESFRLLPGESPAEFEKLHKAWLDRYQHDDNADDAILLMLEKLAQDDWLQTRGAKAVSDAQYRLAEAQIANEPEEVIEKFERRLLLMVRYKTALENSFHRRLKDIEALLARAKREELQERTVFMRENALVQNILLVQEKRDVPPHLPWRPTANAKRAFKQRKGGGCAPPDSEKTSPTERPDSEA